MMGKLLDVEENPLTAPPEAVLLPRSVEFLHV